MSQNRRIFVWILIVLAVLLMVWAVIIWSQMPRAQATEVRALHGLSRGDIFIRDSVVIMTVDNLNDGRLRVTNQGPPVIHGDYYTDEPRQGDPVEVIRHGTQRWHAVMDSIWAPIPSSTQ